MRLLYDAVLYLAAPFILLRLWWRGHRQPEYRQRIGERLGRVAAPAEPVAVWVHAVSVGESVAAAPLIEALIGRHGERRVWVTTTTPTGSARIQAGFGERVLHSYAPYDWPGSVARFLDRVRPARAVVMETEIWPNLFRAAARRGIALTIANARLSPRSFRGYRRLRRSIADVLADCSMIAAQSETDAERFRSLGAPRVRTLGNLKFELTVPEAQRAQGAALRAALGAERPVWVAASTHEGEEQAALTAHEMVLKRHPEAVLILVPRHPQRFDAVARLVGQRGLVVVRRSHGDDVPSRAAIYLGDTMGEMFAYLGAADVAFVGGSLAPAGGHNVLEPAALGLPVLFGPHMHNFEAARALLLESRAGLQVADSSALGMALSQLLGDVARRRRLGEAGRAAVAANRGALDRLLRLLDESPSVADDGLR